MCDELDYNILSLNLQNVFKFISNTHSMFSLIIYGLLKHFWSFEPDLHAVVCLRANDALLILYNIIVIYHAKIQNGPGSEEYW